MTYIFNKRIAPKVFKIRELVGDDADQFTVGFIHRPIPLEDFETSETVENVSSAFDYCEGNITWVEVVTDNRQVAAKYAKQLSCFGNFDRGWCWGDYDVSGELVHFAKPNYRWLISDGVIGGVIKGPVICNLPSPWADVGMFEFLHHKIIKGYVGSYHHTDYGFCARCDHKLVADVKKAYLGIADVWVEKKIPLKGYRTLHISFLGK